MLIIQPISTAAVGYYFQGQGEGIWLGKGAPLLGLDGCVRRSALSAVLRGCDPGGGGFLPEHKPARRRAGWDLIAAAPKSVSLLAAAGGPDADLLTGAHLAAVGEVVNHFETEMLHVVRSRATEPGDGLVAAAFAHHVNATGEPHLHSHLVVANLARGPDGLWSHVHNCWWPDRLNLKAVYDLGLRHHLAEAGLRLHWRFDERGVADVAGVPRATVRMASGRSREVVAEQTRWIDARQRVPQGVRHRAGAITRADSMASGPPSRPAAGTIERAARDLAAPRAPVDLDAAVTARLAGQRSSFRRTDVFLALAASAPHGFDAGGAARWVGRYCAQAIEVKGGPRRWTTPLARAADDRLVGVAETRTACPAVEPTGPGELGQPADTTVRALLAGSPVSVLAAPDGRSNLLAHAQVIEAAAEAWTAAGRSVVVASASRQGAVRWEALTGIGGARGGRPDVLLIDHADRRPTPELLALTARAERSGAQVVFIEGGTAGRLTWMRSDGLDRLTAEVGRLDPGPGPTWSDQLPGRAAGQARGLDRAASTLLAAFTDHWLLPDRLTLVGLGPAEVDGLNLAARAILVRDDQIGGPGLECGGRTLQAGDQVVALRRVAPEVAPSSLLAVREVDTRRGRVVVEGSNGQAAAVERREAAHLGYGYALTPGLAATVDRPLAVLGPPDSMGPERARVMVAMMAGVERDAARGLGPDRGWGLGR